MVVILYYSLQSVMGKLQEISIIIIGCESIIISIKISIKIKKQKNPQTTKANTLKSGKE